MTLLLCLFNGISLPLKAFSVVMFCAARTIEPDLLILWRSPHFQIYSSHIHFFHCGVYIFPKSTIRASPDASFQIYIFIKMVGRLPDSDDEELVRNAMTQARNMGQKIARAVTRSPLSSLRSSPAPHSPSPPALSTPLPVLVRGAPPPAPAPSSALERRLRGLSPHSRSPSPPSAAFYQSEAREVSLPQEQALCSNCASRPRKRNSNTDNAFPCPSLY